MFITFYTRSFEIFMTVYYTKCDFLFFTLYIIFHFSEHTF